jgi:hypothetical protein
VIAVLALAVTEAPGADLEPLPFAVADARNVYSAVARAGGDGYDAQLSYIAVNPSANQARELLLLAAEAAHAEDLLVVYLSSHGILRRGSLSIPFTDARSSGSGHLDAGEVAASLRRCVGRVLLILDCCFSGAALAEANLRDIYDTPNLSVVASALPYGRATYGADGSDFALALVRAMDRVVGEGGAITVGKVAERVASDDEYDGEILVNLAEGLSDLQVAGPPTWYWNVVGSGDFERRFLDRIATSAANTREMLWYNLDGMPDAAKLDVFAQFRDHHALHEPNWLVRRAMGTVLSRINAVHPRKRGSILGFLTAKNWMHACAGLVAGRASLDDPAVFECYRRIVAEMRQMDAVWLANLYLADHSGDAVGTSLTSPLAATGWGVVDIWKRYEEQFSDREQLAAIFAAALSDRPPLLSELRTHLECVGSSVGPELGVEPDQEVVGNELVRFQYARKPRGVLAPSPVKWLVSSLYGSWRDQLAGDLHEYLDNTDGAQIVSDLRVCSRIPSVEHRVNICRELVSYSAEMPELLAGARWAVTDPHPWVRTESLRLFAGDPGAAAEALEVETDRALYPGYFDLLLESYRQGAEVTTRMKAMTKAERAAINWAMSVETPGESGSPEGRSSAELNGGLEIPAPRAAMEAHGR